MKNLYDRAKNLFYNYESFIESNIKIDNKFWWIININISYF
jgi:hypothetical protein